MDKGFLKLSDIINNEPGLKGFRNTMKDVEVLDSFNELFPDLKKIARVSKVEKKTLFLKVENSVWRSELKFSESVIVDKINSFFGEERIKHVKFS
jgi:hypothetical protein